MVRESVGAAIYWSAGLAHMRRPVFQRSAALDGDNI